MTPEVCHKDPQFLLINVRVCIRIVRDRFLSDPSQFLICSQWRTQEFCSGGGGFEPPQNPLPPWYATVCSHSAIGRHLAYANPRSKKKISPCARHVAIWGGK